MATGKLEVADLITIIMSGNLVTPLWSKSMMLEIKQCMFNAILFFVNSVIITLLWNKTDELFLHIYSWTERVAFIMYTSDQWRWCTQKIRTFLTLCICDLDSLCNNILSIFLMWTSDLTSADIIFEISYLKLSRSHFEFGRKTCLWSFIRSDRWIGNSACLNVVWNNIKILIRNSWNYIKTMIRSRYQNHDQKLKFRKRNLIWFFAMWRDAILLPIMWGIYYILIWNPYKNKSSSLRLRTSNNK